MVLLRNRVLSAAEHFSAECAIYTLLAKPNSLSGGEAATWIASWVWVLFVGLFVFLLLLFPTGRLPSSRWRWFAWLGAVATLIGATAAAFSPGLAAGGGLGPIYNPLGVEELPNLDQPLQALVLTLGLVAVASLIVVRLRRARGVERQQIKWFVYATALTISGGILANPVSETIGSVWLGWAGYLLTLVGLIGIPISMGIAILRYRLYEIDLIINRTLVYGLLTAMLVLL